MALRHKASVAASNASGKQTPAGRTKRGEVWRSSQAKDIAQVAPLAQQDVDTSVVQAQELLDDQARQKLRLCELPGALGMGVVRNRIPRRSQRRPCHRERTLACPHGPLSKSLSCRAQEKSQYSIQSTSNPLAEASGRGRIIHIADGGRQRVAIWRIPAEWSIQPRSLANGDFV